MTADEPIASFAPPAAAPSGPLVIGYDRIMFAARAAALLAVLSCLFNLVAWIFGVGFFKSVLPLYASMSVASSFSLAGASLSLFVATSPDRGLVQQWLARGGAALVLGVGVYALGTYLADGGSAGYLLGTELGRIGPVSAIGQILLGAALLDLDRREARLAVWLATAGLVITSLAFVGYAYGAKALYTMLPFSALALPTSIVLAMLFVGVLLARPAHGWIASLLRRDSGGLAARRLLPTAFAPFALGWVFHEGYVHGLVDPPLALSALIVAIAVMLGAVTCFLSVRLSRLDREVADANRTRVESEGSFTYLFENSPLPMWIYDPETLCFLAVNHATTSSYGYSREEFLGMRLADIRPPEDIERMMQTVATPPAYQRSHDWRHRLKDGRMIDVDTYSHGLRFGGKSVRMVVVLDVTARKAAEAQLVQAQKMEAVGQLTGGLAHDFNNLLGIILGNLGLLEDGGRDDPESEQFVAAAKLAAQRGAELTRSLLAFARRQPLRPTRVDPNELVSQITALLRRTLGEQIEISLDPAPDLWPVLVDPAQLESALANLATNARDAMPKGGRLSIVTANRHLDAEYASQHSDVVAGDYAMLQVSDTGTGMSRDVLAKVFEPFFTTKPRGQGTGLGLSMVFGFIKQSGGHINVYSEVGVGTTFRLYMPRSLMPADAASEPAVVPIPRGNGERILVVEDEPAMRRVVVRQLDQLGYRTAESENAAAALILLEADGAFDLLFTDVVMAGKADGFELARLVTERWPATKVVLTSGFPDTSAYHDETAMPQVELLSKPYQRADLAQVLHRVLSKSDDDAC